MVFRLGFRGVWGWVGRSCLFGFFVYVDVVKLEGGFGGLEGGKGVDGSRLRKETLFSSRCVFFAVVAGESGG